MKKVLMTMVSALLLVSATSAQGIDKNRERKVLGSGADYQVQAEMLMFSDCLDGFGLDAEEYELLMSHEFDSFDDMMDGFSFPSCASDGLLPKSSRPGDSSDSPDGTVSLKGGRPGGWENPPIGLKPSAEPPIGMRPWGGHLGDLIDTAVGTKPCGGRPGGWDNPPISTRPWGGRPGGSGDME